MKLSEAIKKGSQILKDAGIPRGQGQLAKFDADNNLQCACALGMAIIAKTGLDKFNPELAKYEVLEEFFPEANESSACLVPEYNRLLTFQTSRKSIEVEEFVYYVNDDNDEIEPEQIAEALEKCGY